MKEHHGFSSLMFFGGQYGLAEHFKRFQERKPLKVLRTLRAAQPRALKVGDVLLTGNRVLSLPNEGGEDSQGNPTVFIHITNVDGSGDKWVRVPDIIPLALFVEEDKDIINAPFEMARVLGK